MRPAGLAAAAFLTALLRAQAQDACPPTPAFSLCEIPVAAPAGSDVRAEFRGPSHKTYLIQGFWNGSKMVLRVTPTEPGTWDYRVNGGEQEQHFTATASDAPGFVEAANVHHFRNSGNHLAHLWMGDIAPQLEGAQFEEYAAGRAKLKFNHVRITMLSSRDAFSKSEEPNQSYFAKLDQRILALNRNGITADLVIAPARNAFAEWFPGHDQRERVIRYLVARYGAMNITWQGFENFESYEQGRELLKEVAGYLQSMDAYRHLVSTGTAASSGALFDDGWMKYLTFRSPDGQIAAIEHEIYPAPSINDFGGATADAFRRNLWRSSMAGQYPESAVPDENAARQMKVWYDFFAGTRHWDLEPYYDVEGAVAIALPDVEYIVYADKPGPVLVNVEKHTYDVEWINPATGEKVAMKNLKSETFSGEAPDASHDWVLHISRESHKAGMLKSYRFEAREVVLQEVESNPAKVPFEITEPAGESIALSSPGNYAVKIKKETRGTRRMLYEWTAEVTADGQSYRVLGTGAQGKIEIPPGIALRMPALLHVRVIGMNALGKVYVADKNVQLTQ